MNKKDRAAPGASFWLALGGVVLVENVIMLFLPALPSGVVDRIWLAFLDGVLLATLSAPIFYYLLIIPERRRTAQLAKMELLANDHLTGLPLEGGLSNKIEEKIKKAPESGFCILMFDPSRLSQINSIYGIKAGDEVLKGVVNRLRNKFGEKGFMARLHGDNFALVLDEHDRRNISRSARELVALLDQPYRVNGYVMDLLFTAGISIYPEHGDSASVLINRASIALHKARRHGNSYSFFSDRAESLVTNNVDIFRGLKEVVGRDEFKLFYQPKVCLKTGRIVGVESLIRWPNELYRPASFIPVAEDTGLIKNITVQTIFAACKQHRAWLDKGIDMGIAINISGRILHDPLLVHTLDRATMDYEVSPKKMTLELTESSIMLDSEKSIEVLNILSNKGYRIALDDFGTGYSSFAYLKDLPVNELKIDKGFVSELSMHERTASMVQMIIELSAGMGMTTVAEGIESEAILERLQQFGCDLGQGYYFAPPLPPDKFILWLHDSTQLSNEN